MERKTVHALLLSLAVVAGGVMMTNDAYAQTNTERLMTTVDNTNSIISSLNALADAVADGFAAVLAAIGMVQADTSTIVTKIGHVESQLGTVHTEVEAIHGEVDEIHTEVDGIGDELAGLDSSLTGISNDLATLRDLVGGSSQAFAGVTSQIGEVSAAAASNSAAINSLSDKLDMISEAVGVVQTTVETQEAEDAEPAVRNMLHSGETELKVAVADFAGTVTKHPTNGVYKASNVFSCDGDVFLDAMSVSDEAGILASVQGTSAPKSTVTVNGFSLYEVFDSNADADAAAIGTNDIADIGKDRDFDNQFLSAGSTLVVKGSTDQSADADTTRPRSATDAVAQNYLTFEVTNDTATAADTDVVFTLADYVGLKKAKDTLRSGFDGLSTNVATKAQLGTVELYTVTVNWFAASSDTTCSISSAVSTTSGLANPDNTVLVALNRADADASPPSDITPGRVDCNGETTEITGASIQAGSIQGLSQFNKLVLIAGGETAKVNFNSDGTLDEDGSNLPFRFSGSDLMINGTALNTLLIEFDYDTIKGNTCTAPSS